MLYIVSPDGLLDDVILPEPEVLPVLYSVGVPRGAILLYLYESQGCEGWLPVAVWTVRQ